jgi:hypothetical protein
MAAQRADVLRPAAALVAAEAPSLFRLALWATAQSAVRCARQRWLVGAV